MFDRYAGFSKIASQQSCQLRLKLQSTNSIAVLLGVDAGINDFVEQCQSRAEEVWPLDCVIRSDDFPGLR